MHQAGQQLLDEADLQDLFHPRPTDPWPDPSHRAISAHQCEPTRWPVQTDPWAGAKGRPVHSCT